MDQRVVWKDFTQANFRDIVNELKIPMVGKELSAEEIAYCEYHMSGIKLTPVSATQPISLRKDTNNRWALYNVHTITMDRSTAALASQYKINGGEITSLTLDNRIINISQPIWEFNFSYPYTRCFLDGRNNGVEGQWLATNIDSNITTTNNLYQNNTRQGGLWYFKRGDIWESALARQKTIEHFRINEDYISGVASSLNDTNVDLFNSPNQRYDNSNKHEVISNNRLFFGYYPNANNKIVEVFNTWTRTCNSATNYGLQLQWTDYTHKTLSINGQPYTVIPNDKLVIARLTLSDVSLDESTAVNADSWRQSVTDATVRTKDSGVYLIRHENSDKNKRYNILNTLFFQHNVNKSSASPVEQQVKFNGNADVKIKIYDLSNIDTLINQPINSIGCGNTKWADFMADAVAPSDDFKNIYFKNCQYQYILPMFGNNDGSNTSVNWYRDSKFGYARIRSVSSYKDKVSEQIDVGDKLYGQININTIWPQWLEDPILKSTPVSVDSWNTNNIKWNERKNSDGSDDSGPLISGHASAVAILNYSDAYYGCNDVVRCASYSSFHRYVDLNSIPCFWKKEHLELTKRQNLVHIKDEDKSDLIFIHNGSRYYTEAAYCYPTDPIDKSDEWKKIFNADGSIKDWGLDVGVYQTARVGYDFLGMDSTSFNQHEAILIFIINGEING